MEILQKKEIDQTTVLLEKKWEEVKFSLKNGRIFFYLRSTS